MKQNIVFVNSSNFTCMAARAFFENKNDTDIATYNEFRDALKNISDDNVPTVLVCEINRNIKENVTELKERYPDIKVFLTKTAINKDDILQYSDLGHLLAEPVNYTYLYGII